MGKYKGFSSVELVTPQKSTFDRSHFRRDSARMGRLQTILCEECLPGDYWNISSETLVRLQALLSPIYDQIQVFVHYFFVPNRLLWEDWEKFITGGRLGVGVDPATAPVPPYVLMGELMSAWSGSPDLLLPFGKHSPCDQMGVPILPLAGETNDDYDLIKFDVLPLAANWLVWYEYYRDRNFIPDADNSGGLLPELPLPSGNIGLTTDMQNLFHNRYRDYLKEYFTSALPFTQRGEEVLIPVDIALQYRDKTVIRRSSDDTPRVNMTDFTTDADGELMTNAGAGAIESYVDNIESISNISSTINDFRTAYALQVWLERNAVGGSRYTESIQAHFAVRPQDARLQRPEYIGGGRIPVRINEVVNTAWSYNGAGEVPAGNLSGHGVTYGNTNRARYFCYEHGFIIGKLSIMAEPSYHQGMPRMFYKRRTFLDYVWPTFAKLGEMQVDQCEVYADKDTLEADAAGVFPLWGYQSQYADWKWARNTSHGDFHDDYMFWTLALDFDDAPTLSAEFLQFDDSTQDRIFAVSGTDNFLLLTHNRVYVKRCLPYFGSPNTLGFNY